MRKNIKVILFLISNIISSRAFVPITNPDGPKGDESQEEVVGSLGFPRQAYSNYIAYTLPGLSSAQYVLPGKL